MKKSIKVACGPKCRHKCSEVISNEARELIFKQFWEMGDENKQREFVVRHSTPVLPKYAYKKLHATRDRNKNKAYHFQIDDKNVRVCRLFFFNTLDIGDTKLRNAFKKTNSEGFVESD